MLLCFTGGVYCVAVFYRWCVLCCCVLQVVCTVLLCFTGGVYCDSRLPAVLLPGGVPTDAGHGRLLLPADHGPLLLLQHGQRYQSQAQYEEAAAHSLG